MDLDWSSAQNSGNPSDRTTTSTEIVSSTSSVPARYANSVYHPGDMLINSITKDYPSEHLKTVTPSTFTLDVLIKSVYSR